MLVINEKLRIVADDKNWSIEVASVVGESATGRGRRPAPENIGKVAWRPAGYYGRLEQALRAVLDDRLRDAAMASEAVDVRALIAAVEAAKVEILKASKASGIE